MDMLLEEDNRQYCLYKLKFSDPAIIIIVLYKKIHDA